MRSGRTVSILAPEPMVSALSVLIDSSAQHSILAAAANLDELLTILGEKQPEILLVDLVQQGGADDPTALQETITRIRKLWSDVVCIVIVQYAHQLELAKNSGANLALLEGISAERLLAAMDRKMT